jgi:hypothetical protein
MTLRYGRPATVVAFVNAVVVYLLPLTLVGAAALIAPAYTNGSTHVVGVDPDRAAVWARRGHFIAGYILGLAPFAMAAAWRTFVHARRRLETGSRGGQGILEGAACGFVAAVLVLLPGIVSTPTHATAPIFVQTFVVVPYVLAYGGLAAVLGLAVGAVLWISATLTLRLYARHAARAAVSLSP